MRLACRHTARSLASILKEANGDEESPPKAALKLHDTSAAEGKRSWKLAAKEDGVGGSGVTQDEF